MIYKQYEPNSLLATFLLLLVVPTILAGVANDQSSSLLGTIFGVFFGYWGTLSSLTIVYRLAPFHALASIPGPFLCKISKLWLAYKTYGGKQHLYLLELHRKYGDVVRIGEWC